MTKESNSKPSYLSEPLVGSEELVDLMIKGENSIGRTGDEMQKLVIDAGPVYQEKLSLADRARRGLLGRAILRIVRCFE